MNHTSPVVFSFAKDFGATFLTESFSYVTKKIKRADDITVSVQQDTSAFSDRVNAHECYRLQIDRVDEKLHIQITHAGRNGLLYALFAVCRMYRENRFPLGMTEDGPLFSVRGYIEGFYGRPWSHAARIKMLRYASSFGANSHYYAPKDDPYHRKLWREKYPDEALVQIKELADTARDYGMEFTYCIAPGLSICYASEEEFDKLKKKILQLHDIGIRSFGLLLDDIAPELYYEEDKQKYNSMVEAHIDLINRTDAFLQTLVGCTLTVCPTEYWGKGDSEYLHALGNGIAEHIRIFFTGSDICAKEIHTDEAQTFFEHTNRKPLYWDNYPVNDAEMFMEMHMGPLICRDKKLWQYAQGEIFNCMEYAECTRIPLATALTYLWNPETYDPESAYMQAVQANIAPHEQHAFILFADHLRTSCLKDENSHIMGQELLRCMAAEQAGDREKAKEIFNAYLSQMQDAAKLLAQQTDGIYKELSAWTEKFLLCVDILAVCGDILFAGADRKEELRKKMYVYNRNAVVLTAYCFREFAEIALGDFSY